MAVFKVFVWALVLFLMVPASGFADRSEICRNAREVELTQAMYIDGSNPKFDCEPSSAVCLVRANRMRKQTESLVENSNPRKGARAWAMTDRLCGTRLAEVMPLVHEVHKRRLAAFNERYPP